MKVPVATGRRRRPGRHPLAAQALLPMAVAGGGGAAVAPAPSGRGKEGSEFVAVGGRGGVGGGRKVRLRQLLRRGRRWKHEGKKKKPSAMPKTVPQIPPKKNATSFPQNLANMIPSRARGESAGLHRIRCDPAQGFTIRRKSRCDPGFLGRRMAAPSAGPFSKPRCIRSAAFNGKTGTLQRCGRVASQPVRIISIAGRAQANRARSRKRCGPDDKASARGHRRQEQPAATRPPSMQGAPARHWPAQPLS